MEQQVFVDLIVVLVLPFAHLADHFVLLVLGPRTGRPSFDDHSRVQTTRPLEELVALEGRLTSLYSSLLDTLAHPCTILYQVPCPPGLPVSKGASLPNPCPG